MKHWRRELPRLPSSSQCSSCNIVPLNWHKKSLHPHLQKHKIKNSIKFSVSEVRCVLGLMLFIKEEEGNAFHAHRLNDYNQLLQMLCSLQERLTLVFECKTSLSPIYTEPVAMICFKPLFPPKTLLCRPVSLPYYSGLFLWKTGFFSPNKLQQENETVRFLGKSRRAVCDKSFPVPLTPSLLPVLEVCSTQTPGPLLQSALVTKES